MKILVNKKEFEVQEKNHPIGELDKLDSSTSVNHQKIHYFESLISIGEIIIVNETKTTEELTTICKESDTFFATFHENPPEGLACRLMEHTKGGLMVTGGFLSGWNFRDSTINLVTSKIQAEQLKRRMGVATPNLGVFVPRLAEAIFRLPTNKEIQESRKQFEVGKDCFHIVYAGRFISNKGIVQLVRALNLWKMPNTRVTLVGDFEDDFFIYQSNASHATFRDYFKREVIQRNQQIEIVTLKSMHHQALCKLYWSADCFVYPSFHEDENFGMSPREAILCGVPFVVTDFCGLGQLLGAKGGTVKTFPTLGGVRYSLLELRNALETIRKLSEKQKAKVKQFNVAFVTDECDTTKSLKALRESAELLLKIPPSPAPTGGWRSKDRLDYFIQNGPESFRRAIQLANAPLPKDLYVDGTGSAGNGWFSEPHFLMAIQALYTTFGNAPKVFKNNCYRGFWRVVLWKEEKALVEFGFPGPRVKRFNKKEWEIITACTIQEKNKEVVFNSKTDSETELIQTLVQLGYLVPDIF